ncbi:MAG: NAD(P)H-hydrate dehydratase [Rhizobiaceae bacterium]|nr:NAD(P)H-hydrate dehydratase [Rhizobiaceae bacterium]
MKLELLTPDEMGRADNLAIEEGPADGMALMRRAGEAVADAVMNEFPEAHSVDVLCGPGNNGGDGYVTASVLSRAGIDVQIWTQGSPRAGSDALLAADACPISRRDLEDYQPRAYSVVVDALYGAGLQRPLEGAAARAAKLVASAGLPVVSIDLPSGLSGLTGRALGPVFQATTTVTFVRKKIGHLLYPGRALCGKLLVRDIGISDRIVKATGSTTFENLPALWSAVLLQPGYDSYKYSRGHVGVFSGGPASTGAARMSAMAAARAGAGAVTMLSPASALAVNAAHLTSIILRRIDGARDVEAFIEERNPAAFVIGPGLGATPETSALVEAVLAPRSEVMTVLDADALTIISGASAKWFSILKTRVAPAAVLTPHEGEFRRLFPDIYSDGQLSKLEKARLAAARSNSVVVYKGPDTVISDAQGRAAINTNGSPLLASAGSGDVLAGIIAGFASQGMPSFEAACAAVWAHAEAASIHGPGLIAEDLPSMLPKVLTQLFQRAP